jgi:hypothetical protein
MTLAGRTRAAFIRAIAKQSHAAIGTLAIEFERSGAAGYTRADRAASLVGGMFNDLGPEEASRRLIEIAPALLKDLTDWEGKIDDAGVALVEALRLEGLAWHEGKLLPATPAPAALEQQLSLLEQQLRGAGFDEALAHYRQAADNLASANHEAANGQTRSFLESLFKGLCKKRLNRDVTDANAALQQLRNSGWLDDKEWNHFRYFWGDVQDNGPHAGLTTADEALFRFHMATAVGRYLITKG